MDGLFSISRLLVGLRKQEETSEIKTSQILYQHSKESDFCLRPHLIKGKQDILKCKLHWGSPFPISGQSALDGHKLYKLKDMTGKEVSKALSVKALFLGLVLCKLFSAAQGSCCNTAASMPQPPHLSFVPYTRGKRYSSSGKHFTSLKPAEYWKWSLLVPPLCPYPMKSPFPIVSQTHLRMRRDCICTYVPKIGNLGQT